MRPSIPFDNKRTKNEQSQIGIFPSRDARDVLATRLAGHVGMRLRASAIKGEWMQE
jgi:hypothetical protein